MKQIESINHLHSALNSGVVALAEPDGTFRYLTNDSRICGEYPTAALKTTAGYNDNLSIIAFDLQKGEGVIFDPQTYQGMVMDLSVHQPDQSEIPEFVEGRDSVLFAADSSESVNVVSVDHDALDALKAEAEGEDVDEEINRFPFTVAISSLMSGFKRYEVNGYGIDANGVQLVQPYPGTDHTDTVGMMGMVVLTKDEGAKFVSAALEAGKYKESSEVGMELEDGDIAVKAIQHIHRFAGTIGFEFQ